MVIRINENGLIETINYNHVTNIRESDTREFALCFCLTNGERVTTGRYRDSDRCNAIIDEITLAHIDHDDVYELPQA